MDNLPKQTLDTALQLAFEDAGFWLAAEKKHQTKMSAPSAKGTQENYVFAMEWRSERIEGDTDNNTCFNGKEVGHLTPQLS